MSPAIEPYQEPRHKPHHELWEVLKCSVLTQPPGSPLLCFRKSGSRLHFLSYALLALSSASSPKHSHAALALKKETSSHLHHLLPSVDLHCPSVFREHLTAASCYILHCALSQLPSLILAPHSLEWCIFPQSWQHGSDFTYRSYAFSYHTWDIKLVTPRIFLLL